MVSSHVAIAFGKWSRGKRWSSELPRQPATKSRGGEMKVTTLSPSTGLPGFSTEPSMLAAKKARRMDRRRLFASTASIIADHFKKPGKVIRTERFRPHEITNFDKKGIILGYSSKSKVITRRGKKIPSRRKNGKRELVTLVEPLSADGYIFATFLITKGTGRKPTVNLEIFKKRMRM
jgi:hypothetical protein